MKDEFNKTVARGDDYTLSITYKDSTDTAVNLTGYTASLTLRRDKLQATADLTLTSSSGITLGGSAGTILCLFTDTQTTALSGRYFYKLSITSSGGTTSTILTGSLFFE